MNILRRISTHRLLLLCGLAVALGAGVTAIASALASGPTPPPKPLAQAIHDALAGPPVQGVSARVTLTDHLLEGANLASGGGPTGELASSPLIAGAAGRLWISSDGRLRLELQAEKGDTQILYDGKSVSLYDAASNTLYRYTPRQQGGAGSWPCTDAAAGAGCAAGRQDGGSRERAGEAPSVAKIEEAIAHVEKHASVSEAKPRDIAGQAAYTVRVSPKEGGSLLGGAELSFDAVHGVPLRAAIYSSTSASPVIELAASEISYGPVEASVFSFTPPAGAKVQELGGSQGAKTHASSHTASRPKLTTHGHGPSTIAVLEAKSTGGKGSTSAPEELPKVSIDGTSASELRTALGTVLSFERSGVRYIVAGAVAPAAVEAVARGL